MISYETAKFLLELNGYVVINDVLSKQQVASLNRLIDDQCLPPPKTYHRFGSAPIGSGLLAWHQSFVDLLLHQSTQSLLEEFVDANPSLQCVYGIYQDRFQFVRPNQEHDLLYSTQQPLSYVDRSSGSDQNFSVVWSLTDSGPGIGGVFCFPGSHNTKEDEFPGLLITDQIRAAGEYSEHAVMLEATAGSVTLINHKLQLGLAEWHGPHQRRELVFDYTNISAMYAPRSITPPANVELTPNQRALFK